jgi:ribosome-associated protein
LNSSSSKPSSKKSAVKAPQTVVSDSLNDLIVDAMQDIKGKNIVKLDLRHLHDAPTNCFIICEGESNVQVRAISDSIYRKIKEHLQTTPSHIEGGTQSNWVVMDYFDTVVHVFQKETRAYYDLESLWSDAKTTEYQDV